MSDQQANGEILIEGKWAILFKAQLVCLSFMIPALLTWGTWVTINLMSLHPNEPRYTHADAAIISQQVQANATELHIRRDTIETVKVLASSMESIVEGQLRLESLMHEQIRRTDAKFLEAEDDMNRRVDKVEATDREFLRLLTELFNKIKTVQ